MSASRGRHGRVRTVSQWWVSNSEVSVQRTPQRSIAGRSASSEGSTAQTQRRRNPRCDTNVGHGLHTNAYVSASSAAPPGCESCCCEAKAEITISAVDAGKAS